MRFLFTVASYYPTSGGVQMVTQYTAEELVRLGHEVTIVVSTYQRKSRITEHNGVKLCYADIYTKSDRICGNRKSYIDMIKKLAQNADVMVNVSLQTATTDALLSVINEFSCKTVLYLHDIHDFKFQKTDSESIKRLLSKCYYNFRRRIFYAVAHNYIKNYSLITHLSEFDLSMSYMKKHGITQNVVIGNAAQDQLFHTNQMASADKDRYLLCVATYEERKYQEFALKAFYGIKNSNVKLLFIGREETVYLNRLRLLKSSLDNLYGKRDVTFLVGISREKTVEYICNAYMMLLSSNFERFPIVLVEAMASGIPFISTDQGCIRYLPGGNVVKTVDEMTYWMDFYLNNPDLSHSLGQIGRSYAHKHMTVKAKVAELLEAVKNIQ